MHRLSLGFRYLVLGCCLILANAVAVAAAPPAPSCDELEAVLWAELDGWFPRCVDEEQGGFTAEFDDRWNPTGVRSNSLVFQARMTWVAAEVARRRPEHRERFAAYAEHGLRFLEGSMWDDEHGGFFWELDAEGRPDGDRGAGKHAYGIGFAIYATANVYRLNGDEAALALAQRAFRWLERHAADPDHRGYIEAMDRQGAAIQPRRDEEGRWAKDVIGTAYGHKSMNTHIHLLEAYTALYRVWPDPLLRDRLRELFEIVLRRIYVEPGCLHLFFTPDWTPVPDHVSFGHNVETTYLLLEAAELLGPEAEAFARGPAERLTAHALQYGYDDERGGLYDAGSAFGGPTDTTRVWWAQAEALNAFHLMSVRRDEDAAANQPYADAFASLWQFVAEFSVDQDAGGWWWSVDEAGQRVGPTGKGNAWKAAYHTGRALLEITDRMRAAQDAASLE